MMSTRIRKQTKATKVLENLRLDIINGKLAPGEKLQMELLKECYGVGFSPLREALSRLVSNGLVQAEEQCGFSVAPLSLDDFYDLYKVRAHIETLALELAIQQGDAEWEAEMITSWHRFSAYVDPKNKQKINIDEWSRLQKEFLFSLIKACQSPWLLSIHNMLYDQATRYRTLCLKERIDNKPLRLQVIKTMEPIVKAALARDSATVIKLSQKNWNDTIDSIAKTLNKYAKETPIRRKL